MARKENRGGKRKGAGRPRNLVKFPQSYKSLLKYLEEGNSINDSCLLSGVVYETQHGERSRNPEFNAAVQRAELVGKAKCIKDTIKKKPEFILERKYWREFARRNPESLSLVAVLGVVTRLFTRWLAKIPAEHHGALSDDLELALDELRLAAGGGQSNV